MTSSTEISNIDSADDVISAEMEIRSLLTARLPLLDVRAPIEFARGSLPGAINIPVLDDEERRLVGTEYKGNA